MSVIPALGRLKKNDLKFKNTLDYMVSLGPA